MLRNEEVPVNGMVLVEPHTAVDVHDGVRYPMSRISRPECGGAQVFHVGVALGDAEPPAQCQANTSDVDVRVGQALRDGLETADRAIELDSLACVFGGEFELRSRAPHW